MSEFLKEIIPPDIISILDKSGYDTKTALLALDDEAINQLEQYIFENKAVLQKTSFQTDGIFKFKPGHRKFLLEIPKQIKNMIGHLDRRADQTDDVSHSSDFSYILNLLINAAKLNSKKQPKGSRYHENIRYFATYIYIMCGKACYETLSANLPLPKAQTIRMYIYSRCIFRINFLYPVYFLMHFQLVI